MFMFMHKHKNKNNQYFDQANQYIDNSHKKIEIAEIEQAYGLDDGDQNEGYEAIPIPSLSGKKDL